MITLINNWIYNTFLRKYDSSNFSLYAVIEKAYVYILISFVTLILLIIGLFLVYFFADSYYANIVYVNLGFCLALIIGIFLVKYGKYQIAVKLLLVSLFLLWHFGFTLFFNDMFQFGQSMFIIYIPAVTAFFVFYSSLKVYMAVILYFLGLNIVMPFLVFHHTTDHQILQNSIGSSLNSSISLLIIVFLFAFIRRIANRSLKRSQAELIHNLKLNKELENLVEQRTAQLHDAYEEISQKAKIDPLTGLYNRLELQRYIDETNTINGTIAVLFLDLDNFKYYNDTFGHSTGDKILQKFGETLRNSTRTSDIIARYGGDEFIVLMVPADIEHAKICAGRIIDAVNTKEWYHKILGENIDLEDSIPADKRLSCSIGISIAKETHELNTDKLLSAADDALYTAKYAGKNRYAVSMN